MQKGFSHTKHHTVRPSPVSFGPDCILIALLIAAFVVLAFLAVLLKGVQLINPNSLLGHLAAVGDTSLLMRWA